MPPLSYNRSHLLPLKREYLALQNMKFKKNYFFFFGGGGVIFALLD
jgi:hypothetical protein